MPETKLPPSVPIPLAPTKLEIKNRANPPKSEITPPIIASIARIVTPIGLCIGMPAPPTLDSGGDQDGGGEEPEGGGGGVGGVAADVSTGAPQFGQN